MRSISKPRKGNLPEENSEKEGIWVSNLDDDANGEDEQKFKPFTDSGKRLDDSNKRVNQEMVAPEPLGASNPTSQKPGKLEKEPQKAPVPSV
uniref:Uncharacterized protein n=1 Tax=Oryza brachyantha TaxID=4533 RepID=J3M0M2_ORYBR